MLQGFTPRLYQETILATASLKNTLVVLPTGMGKTGIALMLSAQRLKNYPKSKVVILAPTKPLAEQHLRTFSQFSGICDDELVLFTGATPPSKRAELWGNARVVFSTPQGFENDVIGERIDVSDVSLIVFDEAHRAVGEYSYVFVAKQYLRRAKWPRILALTASPGSSAEKVDEVCRNLFIEAIEVRTDSDPDVRPYIQEVDVKKVRVEFPERFAKVRNLVSSCIRSSVADLRALGIRGDVGSRKALLAMQRGLQARMSRGERGYEVLRALSILAEIMKAQHALELIETQGISQLCSYMSSLFEQAVSGKTKAVKNLCANPSFKGAFALAQALEKEGVEHPKVSALVDFVRKEVESDSKVKIIVFTQFRDSAVCLKGALDKVPGVLSEVFVGQAKKGNTGLTQKQQSEMLDMFRDGLFNVLIATSVAEEGLDIPKVDVVAFYEPIASAIRHIQRRGRTGRQEKGRVVIFLTKGTREEAYSFAARNKERRMARVLETAQKSLYSGVQKSLDSFKSDRVMVFADYREKGGGVVKELVENGAVVRLEMLKSADYLLSSRVGVELKDSVDFVQSIIDGRLLEQCKSLRSNYERPLIVVQGSQDIYSLRNVHPNAIRGMIATIAVGFGIPIVYTRDEKDTAALLVAIARREQESSRKDFSPHANRKPVTLREQQEYLVSALPGVGPSLAKVLLKRFKSVYGVLSASEEELKKTAGIGDKIARQIRDLVLASYSEVGVKNGGSGSG
ncbi:DEAD/DEAH box helicase [Candidatus Woesearchaeota archaeon]|nr:MAG: DEAD/DEAH box helicase [Candidatus Woesearchaeota archaeon]